MRIAWLAGLALCGTASPAEAQESVRGLLAEAESQVAAKEFLEAAGTYGRAVAIAQSGADLLAEQEAAEKLEGFLGRAPARPRAFPGAMVDGKPLLESDLLAAILKPLDPKRSGAFVSAHALALAILLQATADGERGRVPDAARALASHAAARESGRCAKTVALYAEGLEAAGKGDGARAVAALAKALEAFVKHGFADLAVPAGTELAALRLASGDAPGAAAALSATAKALDERTDPHVAGIWRRLVASRLKGAPPAVLAPYERAMEPFSKGGTVSAAGGAGGRGGDSRNLVSAIGHALPGWPAEKPLLAVKRAGGGFEVRLAFDPTHNHTQPFKAGLQWHAHGGVTLGFHGFSVGLRMVDPMGTRGQPGGSSAPPPPARAFYRLAEGEVYNLTRRGVSISAGR
ncbi:MAG: hypothetical protein L0216_13200 [Planctomycetales bacterium]|nr:hypothetical protein [Planctomycetales bacterium]